MEHSKVSRCLIAAGALAALVLLIVFFLYIPLLGVGIREEYPQLQFMFWPVLICAWALAGVYLYALTEYFRICARIGQDRSFCQENARGLQRIARCMLIGSGIILAAGILPCLILNVGNAGWAFCVLAATVASGALGVLAWGIGKLLARAVKLKEENDLTI
ncbi:MAG: DUF2975 domain-containing protein [Clostridia bacterium]|nr:DUF2975 domain-containing protein [Clostridia bacterium]